MKYLSDTMEKGLCYKQNNGFDIELIGFSDINWGYIVALTDANDK